MRGHVCTVCTGTLLRDEGVVWLTDAWERGATPLLEALVLEHNHITDKGARELAGILGAQHLYQLRTLRLGRQACPDPLLACIHLRLYCGGDE